MLDKQPHHCWKHRAARVIGEKNMPIEEVHDDGEVQAEREVTNLVSSGSKIPNHSTAEEEK